MRIIKMLYAWSIATMNSEIHLFRKTASIFVLLLSNAVYAEIVIVSYEDFVSRADIESILTSFDLDVLQYFSSIHSGVVNVPCGELVRWVNVLENVNGIERANPDTVISIEGPSYIPTCIPEDQPVYGIESDTLSIPRVHFQGKVYGLELTAPFQVSDLEFIEVLENPSPSEFND